MTRYLIILFLIVGSNNEIFSQSQEKKFFDSFTNEIKEYQLFLYYPDSTDVIYNSNSNKLIIDKDQKKNLDSVFIHYDGFYSQKLELSALEKDSIILDKSLHLEEVLISKKIHRDILGFKTKKRKMNSAASTVAQEHLVTIKLKEKDINSKIESINLFLLNSFRDLYGKKHSSKNKNIEFLLFQSNSENPNDPLVSLLPYKFIINTENANKGWLKINLKNENIKLLHLEYLFIGFRNLDASLEYGIVRYSKLDKPPQGYYRRALRGISDKKWTSPNYINDKYKSVPSIYIETVK
ncbi:hypothetical protein SAMN04488096_10587 [Mesonia phycicola]|uniref:Uncharacterized protein n=1 Tax=Mesonia phycicola TaxID=579105 RepID=A0A1M6EHI8_9FLAO|nr:hypothetical protein [Mesonia phycicola]SHI84901.1 hypothetical protein SAMN04488096_10587 [Mesonia phycicola]